MSCETIPNRPETPPPRPTATAQASIATPGAADRLRARQRSLVDQYRHDPAPAMVSDGATTSAINSRGDGPLDPLHTWVQVGSKHAISMPVAVHTAVGGLSDVPVPGDILCAALASCTDSSIRVVANALAVDLQELAVSVQGHVDVRGALYVDPDVPVAFQGFDVDVFLRAAPGTDAGRITRMLASAEHSCVVGQTLRAGVRVSFRYDAAAIEATGTETRADIKTDTKVR